MLKRLLDMYEICSKHDTTGYWSKWYTPATLIVVIVKNNSQSLKGFVRKGQEQMMADYMMLELLEQGRL